MSATKVTVGISVNADVAKVWNYWTQPEHIVNWNFAHESWHCPSATNDLRPGGSFSSRMEARDGSFGFDFGGVYDDVKEHQLIAYTLGDGRKVEVTFEKANDGCNITTVFDAENQNPVEMQQMGWQAIANNFKSYTESK